MIAKVFCKRHASTGTVNKTIKHEHMHIDGAGQSNFGIVLFIDMLHSFFCLMLL